jgi:protoheme IX farnesyltransferase
MSKSETLGEQSFITNWSAYLACCKLKVVALIVFTALVGMLLSIDGFPPVDKVFWGLIGIGLAAAAGAALNHVIDKEIDQRMERTQNRPVAQGELAGRNVVIFALSLAALSALLLYVFVNTLTMMLTMASMVGYAVIYTMFLKRTTPQNIVIGGAAGAAPPVLGWTSITGELHSEALLLFLIIFVWTPPHFWALAIKRQKEYAKANVPMLPVTHGIAFTKLHIVLYTILLFLVSLMPFVVFI